MSELLTPRAVASILNVTPQTLWRWRSRGGGPQWCTLHKRIYYPARALAGFIKSLPIGGGARVEIEE
jgi:hypothetical protein